MQKHIKVGNIIKVVGLQLNQARFDLEFKDLKFALQFDIKVELS